MVSASAFWFFLSSANPRKIWLYEVSQVYDIPDEL